MDPVPRPPRQVGLFPCGNCKYCKTGYIKQASEFSLKRKGKTIKWTYNRFFSCHSMNILYILKTEHDDDFYLGKAGSCKTRMAKHKSDVQNPQNSNCKKCTEHIRNVSKLTEPYFQFYPFFYVPETHLRDFMENRFIRRFKPTLNNYLI